MRNGFSRRLLVLVVAFVIFGATLPARADGQLEEIAAFASDGARLTVAVFTEDGNTVGLLGIAPVAGKRISFAFNRSEWTTLVALCKKAGATLPGAWTVAGSMAESRTTEPSFLVLYAGATLNLVLDDPTNSAVFSMARSDEPAFETALDRALDRLTP
jgi:hypothetical protein